ncbi:MAG: Gldg family protein [Rhodospirillales bacterium]
MIKRLETVDRSRLALGGLLLALVLFFSVNVFSNATFQGLRLDLTESRVFTLSEGTRNVLAAIDEPIMLRLYYSKQLGERSPSHATYFERARELLERYRDISVGMVSFQLLNPEPFSDDEDSALAAGMRGIPLNNSGELGYFGLAATNSTDDQAVIPFFTTERAGFLEYDLTKIVYALANPKRKVVGVMTALPITGGAAGPPFNQQQPAWAVIDQIREFFDFRLLPSELRQIPEDIDTLMLVHPKGLNEFTLYAVDQFVLGGGRVLVFVDANAEVDVPANGRMQSLPVSTFNKILKTWGVQLANNKVAGDLETARRVNVSVGGKMSVADYVVWLGLSKANFDPKDAVTGDISVINMASSGILETVDGAETKVSPLITTGKKSMAISAEKVMRSPDVVGLFRDFKPGGKPFTLAARIQGTVKTAFPDGGPKENDKRAAGLPEKHLAKSVSPANLIVVADVDMLHARFWTETRNLMGQQLLVPFANNADFVINALDNLGGSDALIGLRGRSQVARPFLLVQEIRQAAERQFRDKEQALQAKLEVAQGKLQNLMRRRGVKDGENLVLSAEDQASIGSFRGELVKVRKELRFVQLELRKDIDRLDGFLKFLNIAFIPLLLGVVTIGLVLIGRVRGKPKIMAEL